MKPILLWAVPLGILLLALAEWVLLVNPGGRLAGLVLLSILLGFAGVFVLAPVTVAAGAVADRWGLAAATVLVGACLSVGVLAIIGSIERGKPGYVWKYGEPARVAIPDETTCTLSAYTCGGQWTLDGKTVHGGVTMSRAEYHSLRQSPGTPPDNAHHFNARVLGNRASTAGLRVRPASSVALGRVPEWTGWTACTVGLGAVLIAIVLPRRTSRTPSEAQ
ncbi:hypothetical protein [Actinomadura livida]|uniref:Uncharacterized protein n=1 Tax=Actinomadura livida TaxID=79909 RepID=A0A7W7IAL9_9ACTN|nr:MULTISPECIES: hypothetical protein [Actinomadura]MBB4773515.1 hypothetical protein [Actinomadura catellatispora]GGU08816.1 hypothetical protein GCM10010208_36560 [Actinomadura livida]